LAPPNPGNWSPEPLTLSYSCQQRCKSGTIEADDDFTVDLHHRRGEEAKSRKLLHRLFILSNVSFCVRNTSVGKKLFHLSTEQSTGLGIDEHTFLHAAAPRA
jgi:hypothetical protein